MYLSVLNCSFVQISEIDRSIPSILRCRSTRTMLIPLNDANRLRDRELDVWPGFRIRLVP